MPSPPTHKQTHLDNRGDVRGQVKHHPFLVFGHADALYRLLDIGRETPLQDLPEIADVAHRHVAMEIIGSESLGGKHRVTSSWPLSLSNHEMATQMYIGDPGATKSDKIKTVIYF